MMVTFREESSSDLFDSFFSWDRARREGDPRSIREFFSSAPEELLRRLEQFAADVEGGRHLFSAFFQSHELPNIDGYGSFERIGAGGTGIVYKAIETALNRPVAIKLLHPSIQYEQLLNEASRAGACEVEGDQRDSIVSVYQVGQQDDGRPYLVMEYCRESLATKWSRRPQNPRDVAHVVSKMAAGVQVVHGNGFIHGDLKPANVMLSGSAVKITDFGHARQLNEAGNGAVCGTRQYAAPEQFGRKADARTDVYAIGATLYEGLTGRPPFMGDRAQLKREIRTNPPPLPSCSRDVRPRIPADLDAICMKCLRKDPQQRYSTAKEVADDLTRFLDGYVTMARPVWAGERLWKWGNRNPFIALVSFGILVVVGISTWVVLSSWEREKQARQYAEQVFDWSAQSLGGVENAFRHHETFPKDDAYRDLQAKLLTISKDHYQKIADLKRDNPRQFPFLESKRGDAHWWLGTVEVRNAYAARTAPAKHAFLTEALSRFAQMQTIFRDLLSAHPNNVGYEFRYGWSYGWKAFALNELGRTEEAISECERAKEILSRCQHPWAPVKLGACFLEFALLAADDGDPVRAHDFVDKAVQILDAVPPLDDVFIEADRRFYRMERVPEVAHKLAEAGSYQAAARMYERLAGEDPGNPWHLYHVTVAELGIGDVQAHRVVRSNLLARFGQGQQPTDRIAYAFAPVPLDGDGAEESLALAEVAEKLPDPRCRAAILYRLDRYDDAIACLNQKNVGRAWDHLLFALSHARNGQKDRGRQSFQAALRWMEKNGEDQGWTESIETSFLLQEYEHLVGDEHQ